MSRGGKKVLIVDDEPSMRDMLAIMLVVGSIATLMTKPSVVNK